MDIKNCQRCKHSRKGNKNDGELFCKLTSHISRGEDGAWDYFLYNVEHYNTKFDCNYKKKLSIKIKEIVSKMAILQLVFILLGFLIFLGGSWAFILSYGDKVSAGWFCLSLVMLGISFLFLGATDNFRTMEMSIVSKKVVGKDCYVTVSPMNKTYTFKISAQDYVETKEGTTQYFNIYGSEELKIKEED